MAARWPAPPNAWPAARRVHPQSAPRAKLDYIARHGADLRPAPTYEESERMAKAFAAETGATYISPYSHPDVVAGAATVGVEILEDWPDVDVIVAPVGGGGAS